MLRKTAFLVLCCLAMVAAAVAVPAPPPEGGFSTAVADQVLGSFRDALTAQNRDRTLALFDRDRMPDYAGFADSVGLLFQDYNQKYESLRVRFHILQTDDDSGTAMVDFTLEADPASPAQMPVRHSAQLRFSFARAGKEWKIVDVQPRDFFTGF
jgi:hypothetical protein